MPRGRQPLSCVFLLISSVVLGLSGCRTDSQNPQAAGTPPTVQVAAVERRDVALTSEWIATMDGYVNAQIQSHVSGYLIRQDYREGSIVSKGQLLFEIDPRPFQATLDQSQGQLAQAEAQVIQAQAQLAKASQDVARDT
ncbi:MAG: biotin/lipoyl-binding protein, partial [Candidatus Acidiferrales bacterium]